MPRQAELAAEVVLQRVDPVEELLRADLLALLAVEGGDGLLQRRVELPERRGALGAERRGDFGAVDGAPTRDQRTRLTVRRAASGRCYLAVAPRVSDLAAAAVPHDFIGTNAAVLARFRSAFIDIQRFTRLPPIT